MSQDEPPKTKTEIKRKQKVSVAERLMFFNKKYPNGCIRTKQIEMLGRPFYRATVNPDIANPARYFTGHAPATSETGSIFRKTFLLDGAEVDCVIDTGSSIIPVEIKSGSKVILSTLRGLSSFIETYKEKVSLTYVITTCRVPEKLLDKITVLPWRFP